MLKFDLSEEFPKSNTFFDSMALNGLHGKIVVETWEVLQDIRPLLRTSVRPASVCVCRFDTLLTLYGGEAQNISNLERRPSSRV